MLQAPHKAADDLHKGLIGEESHAVPHIAPPASALQLLGLGTSSSMGSAACILPVGGRPSSSGMKARALSLLLLSLQENEGPLQAD